jgi:hypothetical protein
MGEAPAPRSERILCIMPFPEPTEILLDILKKHPNVEFRYILQSFTQGKYWGIFKPDVPDGRLPGSPLLSSLIAYLPADTEEYQKATILITTNNVPSDPKLVPNLKFIQFLSAGTDHFRNHPIYKDTDITLTTSSGIHGPPIAEWVAMQLLAFSRQEKLLLKFQREHRWAHSELNSPSDFVGQRLGVLGYGSIGRQGGFPPLSISYLLRNLNSCACMQSSRHGRSSLYRLTTHDPGK